jgi:hypothetical protein
MMQFFNWMTDWKLYCQQVEKRERMDHEEFIHKRKEQLRLRSKVSNRRLIAEIEWEKLGFPYYNIHPRMVSKLCKSDLTKIPSNMLKMPHGFSVAHIRFCQQHPEFTVSKEHRSEAYGLSLPAGSFLHGILMMKGDDGVVSFIMDFNLTDENRQPTYSIFGILPEEKHSMQECIDLASASSSQPMGPYYQMIANTMRLAVTIGFLSDNPTICEADVLNADRSKFIEADDPQREVIAARARRRGKYGFNVGTDLMFIGERPKGERRTSAATGRELEYAHIRGGHPHAVRFGEAKKLVKIMWYVPVTVRDDLPFKKED